MFDKQKMLNTLGLCQRGRKLVYGDELLPAITKNKVYAVVLADNASERTRKQIQDKCNTAGIPVIGGITREELSWSIGMTNRVAVGVSDRGFSKVFKSYLVERGDVVSE
ncbi:ribosomal L7Ae/L30e/S12e/Gadd45 family protein [Erysipelothrix rhusiopathiae]|uniref:Ribosomal protein L7Ae n=1 Tax=Erysipelothrix rhusiopathiae ATCC 19414 TaxID=525280 RepID=E7FUS9_ERYRH|nr:ribosomal L7Ae/L30e/S12e/Gadd45 family protein [Erysipelothrix rhusiopathiae]UPU39673.1 ribosomal L7Ae/L30e/S12e/Gadd45 family protein [Erysipelothrix sp. Poltava]AGN24102.1 ribosomal protein L7Ae/L30e/S12e/Gadd45 family protein [Erysipelothrix rhusiopathiae SY1027]AMS11112.1 50S ribosomal protein L7ae [Erysipelothrix rhusiopathiae]AOO67610.1 50S ribosomal protein L7ae [Erysipelothrix rhusiopathiae]AWU41528.1 50S ribosomal protein L7ae [Erysipelothrix rhusiopathiae]